MNNSEISFILTVLGALIGLLGLALAVVGIALTASTTTTLIIASWIAGCAVGVVVGLWIAKRLRAPP